MRPRRPSSAPNCAADLALAAADGVAEAGRLGVVVAPGETDLAVLLAELDVERRPGIFTYVEVQVPTPGLIAAAHAVVKEGLLTTIVLPVAAAARAGLPVDIELAWLTLTVHSSLEAVGLTAVVSMRLAAAGIPCNMLAGYRHDHVLVPIDRAGEAISVLRA